MADAVAEFLARLDIDEAESAARFMVGRSLAQGEEKRLQISGRAIWKIVATMRLSRERSRTRNSGRFYRLQLTTGLLHHGPNLVQGDSC